MSKSPQRAALSAVWAGAMVEAIIITGSRH
jgi:hypothetical protein